ncbi:MAG: Wzz/FepE/Etk N-terminal domain-containing protein [Sediminibacterium sp.]|jgi:capsular polysaccharide biosynthesis protein|nr:hypothetical protein [Chitinophagaceae bacterium]MCA6448151.1 hypothetical protein [Chitinophagaceae bacterium]
MENNLNLLTLIKLLLKNRRFLISITALAALIGASVSFLLTPRFKATASALAGNPLLNDKARLNNPNIKDLYSYFGNTDDLDRLRAIAESDTILYTVFVKNNLSAFYRQNDAYANLRAFKKDIFIRRSDKDQLLISVELPNAQIAASVANDIALQTNIHLQSLIAKEEDKIIQVIATSIQKNKEALTNNTMSETEKMQLQNTISDQEKSVEEWKQQKTISPNFLMIVEYANPNRVGIFPNMALLITLITISGFMLACVIVAFKNRLA